MRHPALLAPQSNRCNSTLENNDINATISFRSISDRMLTPFSQFKKSQIIFHCKHVSICNE
ncbi:hypothetical protein CV_4089 [Chromobacterium violaceum ATCC 12472]|uniref:Uncharacterized protein n=1 Tax=Chromobacterium violaceum (strain ATCC 12472 / DSM 30191 / JCM 1249 / CCUG 213 / NBRC 12614 / NCIMB 9131 / NCTC 9757 / MK) TaxID=243365 RepID=Q7NQP8_CHRVO|nr:hypothetical protein CV_4089 [Chromobacterium violaceum ATCC 12472]